MYFYVLHVYNEMLLHLEDLYNSVSQYFPNHHTIQRSSMQSDPLLNEVMELNTSALKACYLGLRFTL